MCWTGEQPTGAGPGNMAGLARTAAHRCATQRPCCRHVGAAHVPQPSCQESSQALGLMWTGWTAQPGSASDTVPTAGVCLTHSSPSKPPFPPQFRLLPGPLVVPDSPGTARLCSGLGHAHGCAALPAPGSPFCPGLSDPGTASGSCSRLVPQGFRSGLPSFGEEGVPLLHTSG